MQVRLIVLAGEYDRVDVLVHEGRGDIDLGVRLRQLGQHAASNGGAEKK